MTDAERVPLATAGDGQAFEDLFAKYQPLVVSVSKRARAVEHADDAAQLVFVWLLTGRWRLDELSASKDGTLNAFVTTLTRYAVWKLKYSDRNMAQLLDEMDDDQGIRVRIPRATTPTPEQAALRRERLQRLFSAIRDLPPRLRRVARLRYLEDMSGPDIAEDMGVASVTIPGYLGVIRDRLRTDLSDVYNLPTPRGRSRGGFQRLSRRTTEAS